jgi:hypothetical protein
MNLELINNKKEVQLIKISDNFLFRDQQKNDTRKSPVYNFGYYTLNDLSFISEVMDENNFNEFRKTYMPMIKYI